MRIRGDRRSRIVRKVQAKEENDLGDGAHQEKWVCEEEK